MLSGEGHRVTRCLVRYGSDSPIVRVRMDPTGSLAAVASADRSVGIVDLATGVSVAGPVRGHAEAVAGLAFVSDAGRLITASRDGCIFVWRLPATLVHPLRAMENTPTHVPMKVGSESSEPTPGIRKKVEYCAAAAVARIGAAHSSSPAFAAPGARRPTIHDLKGSARLKEATRDISPQICQGQDEHGGEAAAGADCPPLGAAFLKSDPRRTRIIESEVPSLKSGHAGSNLLDRGSDSPAGTDRPAVQANTTSETCWAERRDRRDLSAGSAAKINNLTVEALDFREDRENEGNAADSHGRAVLESGLGEIEDDDDIEEGDARELETAAGCRAMVADQEDRDFKVILQSLPWLLIWTRASSDPCCILIRIQFLILSLTVSGALLRWSGPQ